jgi:hypothetical protein
LDKFKCQVIIQIVKKNKIGGHAHLPANKLTDFNIWARTLKLAHPAPLNF